MSGRRCGLWALGCGFLLRLQSIVQVAKTFIMTTTLYDQICLMKNLRKAYRKARKGKGRRPYVKEFGANLEKNLLQLQKELCDMKYSPRIMKIFVVRDPKTRVVSASDFRDRVVHHSLCKYN